ncbi:hypothetical protein FGIG_02179 [Fasciola gigantica]|uniref:TOG domain-containing protein n=1 Tax=Fasciola gigantica TaxID=46835 RepID=A0A504YLS1_FASGI|nr:hypothetical protein FGIG_02179 [Fasciola gigantica]
MHLGPEHFFSMEQAGSGAENPVYEVRVATLDCIAVVAHLLGPGNLGPLLEAIPRTDSGLNNSIYSGSNTAVNNSFLEAVQRRLARRQLPHLDSQCRILRGFSTGSSAPASGSHRNGHVLRSSVLPEKQNETVTLIGLDDSTGGVFRRREHLMNDSAFYPGSASKGLRRRPSAGSVNRLPWDPQTGSAGSVASSSGVSSAASPRCLDGTQPNGISQERTLTSVTPTNSHLGTFTGSQNDRETSLKPRLAKPQPDGKSETHSLPSTGRMSPAPLKATPQPFPLSMDRPLRASRGIPASVPLSNPSSGVNTPRRKPVLAPLRRSYNSKTEDQNIPWINSKTPLRSSSSLRGMSPSLLPTRATMVRQSGRSWCALSSSPVRDQSVGRNRFGYPGSTPPSYVPQRLGLGAYDQGDSSISPHCSSRRRRKTVGLVGAATGDDDDNGASEEIYDDDYENDDDVDGNDDDDDDDDVDGDEALIYEDLSSDSGGRKHSTSLTRNRLPLRYPKHATADTRLDNPRVLCRSIDSELSDVTGIRSAASHRRAMRLFEDAERKRLQVDHFQSDDSDQTRRSFQEPLRVSVTEANCAVPVLDPVVVPTLPVQRSTLNKATGQRRITSGTAANGANLSGPATIVDAKTTASPRGQGHSPSVTTPGAKYNPYTGASFRENPDYSDLVIGRATGYSSSTSHVPGTLLEANRTGSFQMHGLHERRPLRGQHNIQNLSISGPHSTPVAESSLPPNNIPCSPSINVVGKGLFDSTPAPSQLSSLQSSSTAVRHISPDGGLKTSRVSTSGTESVVPIQSEPGEEHQMLGASVVGVGLVEPVNSAPPTEKANISTIGPEAQVSTVFRQRILQKKNKELQKLRKGATNPESSGANTNEPVPAKSVVVKSDVSHRSFPSSSSLHELEDQTPPMYTWPPTGRSGGASSNQSNLTKSTQDNTAVTRDSPVGPKPRQPTVERPIPKTKSALEDEDETINESPSSSSETANPLSVPNKTRIASTPASRTTTLISDPTSSSGRPIGDRPLVKGQSALNLNLTTPPLPIVLQQINSEDWEAKVSGLEALSQIALEKPDTFLGVLGQSGSASAGVTRQTSTQLLSHADTLGQAVQAIIAECRNLRSQVSRQAVQTLTSLFQGLGRAMDPHVEVCVRVLLGKTGEAAAAFLRDEVSVAMAALAQTANPSRAIGALLQHGLGHKNPAVRLQTALQIAQIVESLNTRTLQSHRSSSKDAQRPVGNKLNSTPAGRLSSWSSATNLQSSSSANSNASASLGALTDRLVTAASQFLTDGNQETRYHGRRLLSFLLAQPDFEKSVIKQLTGQSLRAMRDAIDQVQTRGVGELPTTSASSRRRGLSPAPSASQSRSSSANVNQKL